MNNKEIKALKFLLNDCELSRTGHYGLDTDIFFVALKEYLFSGFNVLPEHDKIVYLGWDDNWSKDDVFLFEQALENKNFWNIYSIYDDKKIEELKEVCKQNKYNIEIEESYKSRRKRLFTKSLKNKIRIRDNNKCTKCKKDLTNEKSAIHHKIKVIDGGNNDPSNLITLCVYCHHLIHRSKRKC